MNLDGLICAIIGFRWEGFYVMSYGKGRWNE